MAKSAMPLLDGAAIQWITMSTMWDELICLLNFESMFIYSVLQMLACSCMVFDS